MPGETLEPLLAQLRDFREKQHVTAVTAEKGMAAAYKYCQTQEEREGEESFRRGQKALEANHRAALSTAEVIRCQHQLQSSTQTKFLTSALEHMQACRSYFAHCNSLLEDLTPLMNVLQESLARDAIQTAAQEAQGQADFDQLERDLKAQMTTDLRLLPQVSQF